MPSIHTLVVFSLLVGGVLAFPPPFSRNLEVRTPPQSGSDVVIAQNLLKRSPFVAASFNASGVFDEASKDATVAFQKGNGLSADGILGDKSQQTLLEKHSYDGYVDDPSMVPAAHGFMYIVRIHVHANRSIEVPATLFAGNNSALHTFTVRLHGHDQHDTGPWPDFNNKGDGLTEFASDGNTPTGLFEFDLNSPEDDPRLYGPYPVNRAAIGVKGNAAIIVPHIRHGILMHTGQWPGWTPSEYMPNSSGCIHAHPADIEKVWHLLVSMGVKVHPNSNGQQPYPYKPQGLLSVTQIVEN